MNSIYFLNFEDGKWIFFSFFLLLLTKLKNHNTIICIFKMSKYRFLLPVTDNHILDLGIKPEIVIPDLKK